MFLRLIFLYFILETTGKFSLGFDFDIVPSNGFYYQNKEVNSTNLHNVLHDHENFLLFGHNNKDAKYEIVTVEPKTGRSKRAANDTGRIINFNIGTIQSLRLNLIQSPKLIDDSFVFIRRFENISQFVESAPTLNDQLESCFYRSKTAALDVCDGKIKGIFQHNNTRYIIHPIPDRIARNEHIVLETENPIPLYDQIKNRFQIDLDEIVSNNNTIDNIDELPSNDDIRRRRRRFVTKSTNVEMSKDLHIETAIFVDRDLYRHMEKNYPQNTESKLIRFVLAMVNGVQLLYHHPSLGHKINFVLKRLEILYSDPKDLRRSSDIDIFLNSFCSWQRNLNPTSDENAVHYDHAVILTGLDLYVVGKNGKVSSQVVGLAPVAGMCTTTSSCTINEGKHFESVYVVAHEIGHNLGMRHDTSDGNCDPSLFIMSPTLGSGKITWSQCSRDYLNTFLKSSQSKCLLDRGHFSASLDHSAEGILPGERFDADQQCMLKYGKDSIRSRSQELNDICRDLHCQRDRYTWTSHPALEGTNCGENMWCKSGVCSLKTTFLESYSVSRQVVSSKTPEKSNLIDNRKYASLKQELTAPTKSSFWSDWGSPTECESGCLYGESGRLREGSTGLRVYARTCIDYRNRKKCHGKDKKYESCTAKQCYNVPRTTILEFANQICQRAKEFDSEIGGGGLQNVGKTADESCKVFCETKIGKPKSRTWVFPDGTTCRNENSDLDDNYYCVDGRCEKFTCTNSTLNFFKMDPIFCPENFIVEEKQTEKIPTSVTQENGRDYKSFDFKLSGSNKKEVIVANKTKPNDVINNDTTFSSRQLHDQSARNTKSDAYHGWRRANFVKENVKTNSNDQTKRDEGEWLIKSDCHFSCMDEARGIQIITSKYDKTTSLQLCTPENLRCSKLQTTYEFATNICGKYKYKVRGLSGNGMQISPSVQEPDRSCRVACQDYYIYHRFYLVNGEQGFFPFGTKCSPTDNRYCVNGKCLEFGLDGMPVKESHMSMPLYRSKRDVFVDGNEIRARKRRNFLYFSPTNITERLEPHFLDSLATRLSYSWRRDYNIFKEDGIDLDSPIYISTEDFRDFQ